MIVCSRCVLPETYPGIRFDDSGVCNFCNDFRRSPPEEEPRDFKNEEEIKRALDKYKGLNRQYDVLVPVSGGVDSCFTLLTLVEKFGLRALAFHSDHGWDDPVATGNAQRLCRELDVDLVIWKNDLRFMRKLFRYFNQSGETEISPCFACGNMLYLNGLEMADRFHIPLVVNGYSKGQAAMMHDSEKARAWFGKLIEIAVESGDNAFFEKFKGKWDILSKQIIYRRREDLEREPDRLKILFIPFFIFDFYRTDKEQLKRLCRDRFDWRPLKAGYPARTTNCDMIWLNSFRDLRVRRYTHYHDEYSTLIRAGEMSREQALEDLALDPPPGLLERLAAEIGLDLAGLPGGETVENRTTAGPVKREKILLAMLPFWSPLIAPLGIACLKSYLEGHGWRVTTVDANVEESFRVFHTEYFESLQGNIPPDRWGNYFVTGKDVLQNHLMAHQFVTGDPEYRELVKILVYNTFYSRIDDETADRLNRLVDEFYRGFESYFTALLDRERPGVVGFSVFETNLPTSLFAARLVKKRDPRINTVMGGGVFAEHLAPGSPNWQTFLERAGVIDRFIVGEGELLMLKYLRGELPESRRIVTIDDIGGDTLDLSTAAPPDFSDFDINNYLLVPAYGSRSCPFQCKFCSETVQWGRFRKKSGRRIKDELEAIYCRYGRQLVLICDSLLNPVAGDLSRELIAADLAVYWDGYLRADPPVGDIENTMLWRRGGFYKAKLGIESGSPRVLELMNKKVTVRQIKQAVSSLARSGIKTSTCWIIGYPGETEADFRMTLDVIEELRDDIYEVWASPFYYYPTGQADTRRWAEKRSPLYPRALLDRLLIQTWLPDSEPGREETYSWMNRFVQHCQKLGIPNPYTLHELYMADKRWKRLHKNAVPSFEEFEETGVRVDDRHRVSLLTAAPRTRELDREFGF